MDPNIVVDANTLWIIMLTAAGNVKLLSFFDHTNVFPHPFEKRDMQSEEDVKIIAYPSRAH